MPRLFSSIERHQHLDQRTDPVERLSFGPVFGHGEQGQAREEHPRYVQIVGHFDGMLAHEPDHLESIGRQPQIVAAEPAHQVAPAIKQPLDAGDGLLELQSQPRGVMGVEGVLGALRLGQFADGKLPADRQRESRLPEQTSAQFDRLDLFYFGLLERFMPQAEHEPVAGGPRGSVGPPDGGGHALDCRELGGVARLEGVDQLLLPGRELTGILTRQQHGLSGQAVRDGVKFRAAFPRGSSRARTFAGVTLVDLRTFGLGFAFGGALGPGPRPCLALLGFGGRHGGFTLPLLQCLIWCDHSHRTDSGRFFCADN